jgi:DNA-binding NtrC family response regulator
MTDKPAALVLSENRAIREILLGLVASAGFAPSNGAGAPDVILVGCGLRIATGDLEAAKAACRTDPKVPIILVTSHGSEELAVAALRSGMANYLRLPLTSGEFERALEPFLPVASVPSPEDRMIGESLAFRDVRRYLYRAAASSSNVLITGETGTGKELAARFLHRHSKRAAKPLITINCAAIPDSLIESELFGFERGAFTGADTAQDGKFKLGDGGDVFLDEIGDLSPYAQAKTLRVIETGEIQRLGARQPQYADIRIIAATNCDLKTDPGFRRDLYFRLNVVSVHLPPLRERRDDVLPLAEAFRAEFDRKFGCVTTFTLRAKQLLLAHQWPGNIRELRNIIEAAFIEPGPDANGELDLPAPFRQALQDSAPGEQERILLALSKTHWNKSRAASELHWSRMTLYRKMARYRLKRAAQAEPDCTSCNLPCNTESLMHDRRPRDIT